MRQTVLCTCLAAALLAGCHPLPSSPLTPARTPISLTYLGVAGYQLQSGDTTLLADPYFSRPVTLEDPLSPDAAAIAAHAPRRADLILVGHSHADHLLDVPSIALRSNAQVLGSLSTARVARASGVPQDQIITIKGGEDFAFDGYSVRVIPSLHSALDHKHGFGEEIGEPLTLPLRFADYKEGGTFAYLIRIARHELLFLGTANFIESELQGLHPDIAIVATGLRHEIHDYTCRLMRVLNHPAVVLANHFDDWHAAPRDSPPDADLSAFVEEVHACSPATRVIIPQHFVAVQLP